MCVCTHEKMGKCGHEVPSKAMQNYIILHLRFSTFICCLWLGEGEEGEGGGSRGNIISNHNKPHNPLHLHQARCYSDEG